MKLSRFSRLKFLSVIKTEIKGQSYEKRRQKFVLVDQPGKQPDQDKILSPKSKENSHFLSLFFFSPIFLRLFYHFPLHFDPQKEYSLPVSRWDLIFNQIFIHLNFVPIILLIIKLESTKFNVVFNDCRALHIT